MNDVKTINENVFRILRESIFPESFPIDNSVELSPETFSSVYSEMMVQTVSTLPDRWLDIKKASIPEKLYTHWKEYGRNTQIKVAYLLFAQRKLIKLLEDNGIKCVVIKGAAASMLYPDPFLRQMGDIDLLVKRADYARACELMVNDGYEAIGNSVHADEHHREFSKFNVCFELHRRLPIVDEKNEGLIRFFEDGIDEAETASIENVSFPVLPTVKNGLVLLFHINQHLRVGLGLRQIVDWMMFVDKHITTSEWETEYGPLLSKLKLDKFAKIVTKACVMHLGLGGDRAWCMDADEKTCTAFIDYIMEKGNFAVKVGEDERIASVFARSTNPFTLIGRMHRLGVVDWPAARKHKLLRPFASIRYGVRRMGRMKKDNISAQKLNKLKNDGLKQREFIESLGLDADRIIYDD